MLNTPKILGISMAPQKNRRLLVMGTYATLVACVMIILTVAPLGGRIRSMWLLFLPLVHIVASSGVFGKMVKSEIFRQRGVETTSLGLSPRHRNQDEPDERDLALRNAAHYKAFRAAAMYGFILWASIPFLWELSRPNVILLALLFAMPLLTMLWTLPQAIILWKEPDVPEEARIYNS